MKHIKEYKRPEYVKINEYKRPEYVKINEGGEIEVHPANPAVGIIVAIAVIAITYA